VFFTLAHYLGGAPAQPDVMAAAVPARTPEGKASTMRRWVLQDHVWVKILDEGRVHRNQCRRAAVDRRRAAHCGHTAGDRDQATWARCWPAALVDTGGEH